MIYIVTRVIAFSFNELYKFIRRRTQKSEECGVSESKVMQSAEESQELSKEKTKNTTHECAACSKVFTQGVEDETLASVEKKDAKGEHTISENVGIECSNVFTSRLVAQASSPKSQKTTSSGKKSSNSTKKFNSRTTSLKFASKSTRSKKKGRRFRKFVPKPSSHDILKKKLLEKRRQIFQMYTFKL